MPVLDAEAAQLRAAVRARLFDEAQATTHIGRYEIREQLGRGGMGVVYAAFDPQLDRVVALKVLRPARGAPEHQAETRLLQEARSLARLSHPNVVTIYAAGRLDGQVFLSMKRLVGTTLRGWLEAADRPRREVYAVFAQAARGLAAAHAAGLVHRDFKPDNVMVTADAQGAPRAVVVDFGLAQGQRLDPGDDPLDPSRDVTVEESGRREHPDETRSVSGTGSGWVMGTRAYMAPELARAPASASSDLYAFALSLCEGLGAAQRAESGLLRVDVGKVPWRLRASVRRALHRDPRERGDDLTAMAQQLERARTAPRRTAVGIGLGALGVAAVVPWVATPPEQGCGVRDRIGAVWSDARRERVADALAGEPAFVGQAWTAAAEDIDRQMDALAEDAEALCRATREPQGAVALRRLHCLEGTVVALDEALRWVEDEPHVSGGHVSDAWLRFELQEDCAGMDAAATQAASPRFREHFARGQGALRAGQPTRAVEEATAALGLATADGPSRHVAEAGLLLGRAQRSAGRFDEAQSRLYEAIEAAEGAASDRVAAQAWIALLEVTTQDLARFDEARRVLGLARGAVARVGDDALLQADLRYAQAMLEDRSGHPDAALPHYKASLEVYERLRPATHPSVQRTLHGLALVLRRVGDPEASVPHARRALSLSIEGLGAGHPDVGLNYISVGAGLSFLGQRQEALDAFSSAVEVLEAALGGEHPSVAAALHDRGNVLASLQRFDEAYADLLRAHAIDDKTLAADNPTRAQSLYGLAMVQRARGEADDAQTLMEEALAVQERVWGSSHPDLAYVVGGLGDLALDAERWGHAREHYARALRLLRPALDPAHPRLVFPLMGSARVELADDAPEAAESFARQAVDIVVAGGSEPLVGVEARLLLARAQVAVDGDGARARETIAVAEADCASLEPPRGPLCDEVSGWQPPDVP